jgi:transcriptional regulator with XRE-family HTH domain
MPTAPLKGTATGNSARVSAVHHSERLQQIIATELHMSMRLDTVSETWAFTTANEATNMATEASAGSLAQRIDHLFKSIKPKGREYSYEEVARGCEALSSGTFSKTYVWQLRTGQRDNPTKRHLEALATFFGVPVAYFFEDSVVERVNSQLALAAALRDADVRDIALRALQMDEVTRRSLARIVTEISQMQRSRAAEGADHDTEPDR